MTVAAPQSAIAPPDVQERLAGVLLGTALGDALGVPAERLSARAISRRWGRVDRFHFLGQVGFVSDDAEQAALLAQSLAHAPDDPDRCAALFRRAMVGWFLRLPWGVGLATIRSCARAMVGIRRSGVPSAGNGAAMRAAVVGVFYVEQPERRRESGRALAEVTHTDPRGLEGALYVAELAAACARTTPGNDLRPLHGAARVMVTNTVLLTALDRAAELAEAGASIDQAAAEIGTSGYVVHTVPLALFCFLRSGNKEPLEVLVEAISAGGDTDSIAAIVGGWLGALHGARGLPADLLARIHDGPFGPTHLRALAACLSAIRTGDRPPVPGYSPAAALARNLLLYPVVLGHAARRALPF